MNSNSNTLIHFVLFYFTTKYLRSIVCLYVCMSVLCRILCLALFHLSMKQSNSSRTSWECLCVCVCQRCTESLMIQFSSWSIFKRFSHKWINQIKMMGDEIAWNCARVLQCSGNQNEIRMRSHAENRNWMWHCLFSHN